MGKILLVEISRTFFLNTHLKHTFMTTPKLSIMIYYIITFDEISTDFVTISSPIFVQNLTYELHTDRQKTCDAQRINKISQPPFSKDLFNISCHSDNNFIFPYCAILIYLFYFILFLFLLLWTTHMIIMNHAWEQITVYHACTTIIIYTITDILTNYHNTYNLLNMSFEISSLGLISFSHPQFIYNFKIDKTAY